MQGRFTSPDPILISEKRLLNPQMWNAYSYVGNNPLRYIDPDGMECIKLGDSEETIKSDLEKKKAEKKAINKDKSLTKEERKQKKAGLDGQIKTLNAKLDGTRAVNSMLRALDKTGDRNGLQLSDFTLTTDAKNDFPGVSADNMTKILSSQAFVVQDNGTYSGSIYIRTDTSDGFYRQSQSGPDAADYIFYGGSALRHEQVHLQGGRSEHKAFEVQHDVWQRVQNYIQNKQLFKDLDGALKEGIKNNP